MKHASLFSGIGGFDLAADWMGWKNTFHCEWNPFGQKVLKHYWPEAESFNDITKTDFTKYANQISILTGGFPCQPYSSAGKRKGKDDDRHLWPEMLRAIREIRPRWVVGENVRGLTNWNGGMVFDEVQADLESEGYEVLPFLLPACAVNAPHRRDRIWFVAYRGSKQFQERTQKQNVENPKEGRTGMDNRAKRSSNLGPTPHPDSNGQQRSDSEYEINTSEGREYAQRDIEQVGEYVANTDSKRYEKCQFTTITDRQKRQYSEKDFRGQPGSWQNFPTEPPVCSRNDGLPTELDGITFSKFRNESIKGYGNAIVPQVAYQIFKAIQEYELQKM